MFKRCFALKRVFVRRPRGLPSAVSRRARRVKADRSPSHVAPLPPSRRTLFHGGSRGGVISPFTIRQSYIFLGFSNPKNRSIDINQNVRMSECCPNVRMLSEWALSRWGDARLCFFPFARSSVRRGRTPDETSEMLRRCASETMRRVVKVREDARKATRRTRGEGRRGEGNESIRSNVEGLGSSFFG